MHEGVIVRLRFVPLRKRDQTVGGFHFADLVGVHDAERGEEHPVFGEHLGNDVLFGVAVVQRCEHAVVVDLVIVELRDNGGHFLLVNGEGGNVVRVLCADREVECGPINIETNRAADGHAVGVLLILLAVIVVVDVDVARHLHFLVDRPCPVAHELIGILEIVVRDHLEVDVGDERELDERGEEVAGRKESLMHNTFLLGVVLAPPRLIGIPDIHREGCSSSLLRRTARCLPQNRREADVHPRLL